MSNKKTMGQANQARIEADRDAKNAGNAYKNSMSAGVRGPQSKHQK